jgi:hypothetical protein
MFHASSPGYPAILGGKKDSAWDRSFTVRKAARFHSTNFDDRLLENVQNTAELVNKCLENEDALDPHGLSHTSLRRYLRPAIFASLTSPVLRQHL